MKLTTKWRRTFSRQISDNHFCLFRNFSHIVVYFFPRPVSIIYQYRSEPHLLKLKKPLSCANYPTIQRNLQY